MVSHRLVVAFEASRGSRTVDRVRFDIPEPIAGFGATVRTWLRLDACGDAEFVALVADAHRDALGELYRRYAGWLILRLRHRCADDGLAAEALQDTFVAVWRGAAGYRGSGEVAGWLWAISIRRLIALLHADRHRHAPCQVSAIIVSSSA